MRFRDAEPGDVEHIARLHADSWRRHYRGAFPDSYLDGDILADRVEVWSERLAPPTANQSTTVVEIDGELAGFVHTIFDEDPKWGALVDNLHVTYARKRAGLGSLLMAEAARAVLARPQPTGLHLWVLEQNAAGRAFYAARGGVEVEHVADGPTPGGSTAPELRVAWPDPAVLLTP
jgi:hypothetical protein